ncbi:rfaE bifunctional protein nucleotidyltransferase chain/domain/rfaE bifunctional protein kinase chain/domain [Amycolatopsis bartoniae]|uniref:D-glycero-beta-D-manno-heptose 1-phosphate adenylyltransferase n=1 Tax=Amycolatopsis bartoniae TaxID=941986 RepID=A0A8H9M7M3_9PSEU|nr:D-glycero-beta-D-manno-heptose 1-phosphate adenylyltransferase [Amycolatopsis bartoniae]MBB2935385.1 rfaE bifunctional protein nucleotidyltransferase chain/domain/rfaE bifunctional protein kinase chain/domain [Amycolatopsis bartoniae]TVS99907.1 D-glycero-beta-D-manno-heptose 1-phosphate adenylyltransferase [Amycolatopsis bartoniae]GHF75701.1 bifunctional protein HldE [Amycolatopsis bartoniae]
MSGPLVVVGDALLDIDVEGTAERLCPEAPVPVVDVGREWQRPGGAGLAALLAARSAAEVVLVTAIGADESGARLASLLESEVELCTLPLDGETPCKTRIRAAQQSVARLDRGGGRASRRALDDRTVSVLRDAGAILVADYGRGVADHPQIRELLAEAATRVPVVWDPHPRGGAPVPGARLVTPNDSEAVKFTGATGEPAELAEALRDKWNAHAVAVTLGSKGAVLASPEGVRRVPIPNSAKVAASLRPDTCGAGDRFASAATAALFEGADLSAAVATAVESAARFVAAGAATAVSQPVDEIEPEPVSDALEFAERVRRRGGRLVATGGCFDLLHPGHVSLLRHARSLGDALIVCVNSDASVRRLKGPTRPVVPAADRVRVLAALESVDAVAVFDESSPAALLEKIRPDVWVKGGDYAGTELPEAGVVRAHGGEIVLVPFVDGYSTTRLLEGVSHG